MNRFLALTTLLLACACSTVPRPAPAAAPLACQEVEGLEPLLAPGTGLLLGEVHGTVESPAFVANAACLALRTGRPVTVALEIWREERARVDAFLASAGTEADRAALLDGRFWTDAYQDGRRSQAMLALLDDLRRLRHAGRPLHVTLIDRQEMPAQVQERDRSMAEALAQAFEENPGGVVISLTGNVHSRITRGTPWVADYEPAGFVLATMRPDLRLTALDFSAPDGTVWACSTNEVSSCHEQAWRGQGDGRSGRVVLYPQVTGGHSGVYTVGSLTASPPAALTPGPSPASGRGEKSK